MDIIIKIYIIISISVTIFLLLLYINMDKYDYQYFTLILWNPTLFQAEKILQDIPNIVEKKEIEISKESLHDYIFDIYKLDTRCSHNIVLPPKIKKLKEYNNKHLIVKFKIDNPQYTNNICNQAIDLKEMIRNKYKSNIKNYIKDIMIHVADNFEQSKYIWEKNIDTSNIMKLFVQEAKNPLRYKISKIEKNGKDGWNTINTMNVYKNYVEGTIQFFVYKITNPTRYCLSKEKITDNDWEYCYDFYYIDSEIDERLTISKLSDIIVHNSQKYITGDNFKELCDFYIKDNKLLSINNNFLKPFYGCFIFIRCDEVNFFFNNLFDSIKESFYIVTHNSDDSSPNKWYKYLDNDKIIKWYCKNNDCIINHNKLELIPLGLGNTRDKNILNKVKKVSVSKKTKKYPYKCLISSNFTGYNGKTHPRTICYESLKNNSSIEILPQRLHYEKYLEYILDYGFIISPHGNGLDCTRTWESILLGLIPIVKSSTLDRLYINLPVMIVNDWNEITLDKLKSFKDNCKINERYDLLYNDFWNNKFKNDRMCINIKPIKQIFDKLANYVVLRGYDELHKKIPLLKNSDDIDILLTKKDDIINICGNNIVVLNNERVKFDRRFIGDNYYDNKWQQNMIATRVKKYFFYVLDEENNYYATLYHSLIHKGQIYNKYEKLFKNFENKHIFSSDILSRFYQLLRFMFKKKYSFTKSYDNGVGFFKEQYKLNLFIIRKKGMKQKIIENILNQIQNQYQILDKIIININNKKKFYSNFYGNYDTHKDDIEKTNDNQCLAIITNNPDHLNPNELKQKIRNQYIEFYPPLGNIIHSSDSSNDCEKELEMLFNENIDNFTNIGTYYSQMMI